MFPQNKFSSCNIPCGVVARIRRFHRRGRGSIPRTGEQYFLISSKDEHSQLHVLDLRWLVSLTLKILFACFNSKRHVVLSFSVNSYK